ncbi:MAG: DNA polymerase III subunit delta [Eubacteriales bacterium]
MAKKETQKGSYQPIKDHLKSGNLAKCYLFYGEEDYLKSYYFDRLKKKVLDDTTSVFNHHRFTAENLDWGRIAESVEAMPMMAERTLVELRDVNPYSAREPEREQIIAMMSDLPDYCCLVFYFSENFKADKRLKKLHTAMSSAVELAFAKQTTSELRTWLRRHAVAGGKDIDTQTCDHLAFLKDNSMVALGSEMQKLIAYASGNIITKQDVDAVVEPTLNAVSFDISNAIADGNYERAIIKLREVLQMQEEPTLVLGAISSQMRRMYWAKKVMSCGKGSDYLAKLCSMGEYAARLTMNVAGKRSPQFCKAAVAHCLETDRAMKTSRDNPERLLELLLLSIAQEARR